MDELRRRIRIARGEESADLLLRNARMVNVCSGECYPADVALADGLVVGISTPGGGYRGHLERDLQGRWLAHTMHRPPKRLFRLPLNAPILH